MSWLYSILFTGLLLSSNSDTNVSKVNVLENNVATVVVAGDETEVFEKTYPLSANGRVSVSNVNGSIVVEAWDRNEVHLVATKTAESKEDLGDVEIVVDAKADSLSVETDYKEWTWKDKSEKNRRRGVDVQFKLSVPRTAMLNEVETVNGSVTVSNFVNFTKISTVNGNVNAGNLRGAADLSTVNGEVIADFDRLETGSRINLSTVNGKVNLTIPSDANATIKADSLNGDISNAFGLPVRKGEYVGRDLYGRVGSGEVQIKLNSVNGPLAINRKNDGKTPNEPTNLLPTKRGSDNWDNDSHDLNINVNIDNQKLNRDIKKAVRDAQKVSVNATKEVAKAMENVKLAELSNMKINIDMKDMEIKMKDGVRVQAEAMARMRDAMWMGNSPLVEKKTNSFAVKGTPKVTIDAQNCSVKVRGWDKPDVKYVLTEFTGRRGRNTPASVTEEQTASGVTIKVISNPENKDWMTSGDENTRLEVFVPRKSDLKISTKGEIRLEGVTGNIDLAGEEGAIDVRGSEGKLNVSSSCGMVRVVGFKGELIASTGEGDVYLDGDFSQINGKTEEGTFVLTVPEDINADIQTPGEHFSFTIEDLPNNKQISDSHWQFGKGGRKYTFTSVDGSLTVQNRDLIAAEK